MNRSHLKNPAATLLLALVMAGCSKTPTAPSASVAKTETAAALGDPNVTGLATGDVKVGPVDMDINLVRVAQTDGVPAFYADRGVEYAVRPGRQVEIYVQIWTSNPAVQNPRLIVDWGDGERDNIGCGSCRLTRTYNTQNKYKVSVTLDDRVSSFTTRTFTLHVTSGDPVASGFGTFNGNLDASDPQFVRRTSSFVPPATGLPCSLSVTTYYEAYRVTHLGGPLRIETVLGTLGDSFVFVYSGSFNPASACQNSVAADDDGGPGTASLIQGVFPAGDYVVVVANFSAAPSGGTYTLIIQ